MDRAVFKIFLNFLSHRSKASLTFFMFLFSFSIFFFASSFLLLSETTKASGWTNNYYSDVVAATSPDGTTGYVQRFQNGSIYWNDRTQKAYPVYGEIEREYEIAGGSGGDWGFPISDPYVENGLTCQNFEGKKYCPDRKLPEYELRIYEMEERFNNAHRDGGLVQWCGTYIQKYHSITTNYGDKGGSIIIYNPEDRNAYFMTGSIYWKYRQLNGENCSYPDTTGYPKMNERPAASSKYKTHGWYQNFQHKTKGWSSIYSSPLGTYYLSSGNIRTKFEQMGGTNSYNYLGFPTSEAVYTQSSCGTGGYYQKFEGGNIFHSNFGTHAYKNDNFLNEYNNRGGVPGELGWPKQEMQKSSTHTKYYADFEKATLEVNYLFPDSVKRGTNVTDKNGCGADYQRKADLDSGANQSTLDSIWAKENEIFEEYLRASGNNGVVHPYCGGWAVDYKRSVLNSTHKDEGYSWIMNDNSNSYYLSWDIWQKYWEDGACEGYGLLKSDLTEITGKKFGLYRYSAWKQTFAKDAIYKYNTLTGSKLYGVKGNIYSQYLQAGETAGSYGFPTSDRYEYEENGTKTICQSFDNDKLCEDKIPEKTDSQIAFEEKYDKVFDPNDIEVLCGVETVKIKEGTAIYRASEKDVVEITGNVHHHWRYEGGCERFGFPKVDTTYQKAWGNHGAHQSFYKADTKSTIFHSYDHSWVVLTGDFREAFKDAGGVDILGYPKDNGNNVIEAICPTKDETPRIEENMTKSGMHLDVQNGRIYKVEKDYYLVSANTSVGKYFFDNDSHHKFGLPTSDLSDGSTKTQHFELATIKDPGSIFKGVRSEPALDKIYCPGEAPVEPKDPEAKCGDGNQDAGEECDDGNTTDGDGCSSQCKFEEGIDEKTKECLEKGMIKYTNPNDSEDVVCAKVNPAPYINQYMSKDGTLNDPDAGWLMCGGASALMALGQMSITTETDYAKLKEYVYKTDPVTTTYDRQCDFVPKTSNNERLDDLKGTFSYTALAGSCNQSSWDAIAGFLKGTGEIEITKKVPGQTLDYALVTGKTNSDYVSYIKSAVNENGGVIQGITGPGDSSCNKEPISHIFMIIGYTDDDRVIVNDSYTNLMANRCDHAYSKTGKGAIYKYDNDHNINFIRILTYK